MSVMLVFRDVQLNTSREVPQLGPEQNYLVYKVGPESIVINGVTWEPYK